MSTLVKIALTALGVVVLIGIIGYFKADSRPDMPTLINNPVTRSMESDIYQKVIDDAVDQFEIAERSGDPIQASVHAGLVAAAYLQAKDEANYNKWLEIEKKYQSKAGM